MTTVVFVDANVLYSRCLRDWVFLLRNVAGGGMFTLISTEDVLTEVVAKYRERNPTMAGSTIRNLRVTLEQNLDELFSAYQPGDDHVAGDPKDAHVRAAAVASNAVMLLSDDKNVVADRDDPNLPYEVVTADEFLVLVDDSAPAFVADVARQQREYWERRDGDPDVSARLRAAGAHGFAARVDAHLKALRQGRK